MTSNLPTLSFEDYSSLAHGVAKNLPEGAAVKGSQVLNAMAKHKGFKSAQAFKASFRLAQSPSGKSEGTPLKTTHEPSTARAHFVEAIRKIAHIEFSNEHSAFGSSIKDWALKYHGPLIGKSMAPPTLFEHIRHSELYYSKIVNPYLKANTSPEAYENKYYLGSLDPDLLNEAYSKFGTSASVYVSRAISDKVYKEDEFIRRTLEHSWLLYFEETIRSFFDKLEPHLIKHIKKNYSQKNSSELDVVRLFLKANPFVFEDISQYIESALDNTGPKSMINKSQSTRLDNSVARILSYGAVKDIRNLFKKTIYSVSSDDMWNGRVLAMLGAILPELILKRDHENLILNIDAFQSHSKLNEIVVLGEKSGNEPSPPGAKNAASYLCNLPGFSWEDAAIGQISGHSHQQHGVALTLLEVALVAIFDNDKNFDWRQ